MLLSGIVILDKSIEQTGNPAQQPDGFNKNLQSNVSTRFIANGFISQHVSRFKGKFIAVQAMDKIVNIYRESYSKIDPYQSIPIDMPLQCSLEFHDFWILGGNDGSLGTLQVVKPLYDQDGIDIQFLVVNKAMQLGAVVTICPMLQGGTYLLAGTLQGQVQLFHIDVASGEIEHL